MQKKIELPSRLQPDEQTAKRKSASLQFNLRILQPPTQSLSQPLQEQPHQCIHTQDSQQSR